MSVIGFAELAFTLEELSTWQRAVAGTDVMAEFGRKIVRTAKDEIGTDAYLPGGSLGTFTWPAWEHLAAATLEKKARAGMAGDSVLYGAPDKRHDEHMQDQIDWTIEEYGQDVMLEVGIPEGASSAEYALVQELGTGHVPQRAFLAPAMAAHHEEFITAIIERMDRWERRAQYRAAAAARRIGRP